VIMEQAAKTGGKSRGKGGKNQRSASRGGGEPPARSKLQNLWRGARGARSGAGGKGKSQKGDGKGGKGRARSRVQQNPKSVRGTISKKGRSSKGAGKGGRKGGKGGKGKGTALAVSNRTWSPAGYSKGGSKGYSKGYSKGGGKGKGSYGGGGGWGQDWRDDEDDFWGGGGRRGGYDDYGGDRGYGRYEPSATEQLTAEDKRMMKKITIVAQLDKVPKPHPAMSGMGSGRRRSGDGSLSSRFAANYTR